MELEKIYTGNKVDVYQTLKNAIQYLALMPGSTINEQELASELGVSRTPIREALIRLSSETLIAIYPQKGTYVSRIDFEFANEVAYMRHILDTEICLTLCRERVDLHDAVDEILYFMRAAVKKKNVIEYLKKDQEFHKALFAYGKHELIWDIISTSRAHYNRFVILDLQLDGKLENSYQQHCDILDSIASGDEKKLLEILDVHHDHTGVDYEMIQKNFPEYFEA